MAVEQISSRIRGRANYLSFSLLFCNAIILLGTGLFANNIPLEHPYSIFFFLTSIYLVGPLNLMYYTTLIYPQKPIPHKIRLHIIPSILIFFSEVLFQIQPHATKIAELKKIITPDLLHPASLLSIMGGLLVFAYLVYLIREHFLIWATSKFKNEILVVISANTMAIVSIIFLTLGFILNQRVMFFIGGICLTIIHIFLFISHNRYIEFFQLLKKEMRESKYKNSMLKGINTDLIYDRLLALMTEEFLYREYDTDLKSIAIRLSITTHQLSQFLNEKHGTNFPNFINSYRVEEAKHLLKNNPEQSIISICFHVGFSSKTTFNKVFKKYVGKNPTEYRSDFNIDK